MTKINLTREETIPFYDENWEILQMKNFAYNVSVEWSEWESLESVSKQLDDAFEAQRKRVSEIHPLLRSRDVQISYLLWELKWIVTQEKLKQIIAKAKSLAVKK